MERREAAVSGQRGQALPVGIALIMFATLLGLVLFNTGQLSSEKSRAANAADAAIYSGLIWQARALNFQAYSNRAMVANQVTIGQVVSLTSWSTYAQISAANIDNTVGWFPPAKAFTEPFEQFATSVAEVVQEIAAAAVPILGSVNEGLSRAQSAMYMGVFATTPEIVKRVAEENDPRYQVDSEYAVVGLARNAVQWKEFTKRYTDADDEILRKKDVIDKSLDKFTRSREWKLGMGSGWFYLTPIHRYKLIKEGETRLIRVEDESNGLPSSSGGSRWEWKGKDTLSFHFHRRKWTGGWKRRETPIGWGGAYVPEDYECENQEDEDLNGWFGSGCSQWADKNRRAENLVNNNVNYFTGTDSNVKINAQYNGLQAYYDLRDLTESNRDARLILRSEIHVAEDSLRTASQIDGLGSPQKVSGKSRNGSGSGMFRVDDKTAARSLASISSGEVYYKRPGEEEIDVYEKSYIYGGKNERKTVKNNSSYKEYANLFNPYWEVRLIDTPVEQKLASWLLKEPGFGSAASSAVPKGIERYVEGQEADVEQFQATRGTVESQWEGLTDAQTLSVVEQQLVSVGASLNNVQVQFGNYSGVEGSLPVSTLSMQNAAGIVNSYGSVSASQAILDNMPGLQTNLLDGFKDELKNVMEDALKNLLSRYAGSDNPMVQQATQYYQDAQTLYQEVVSLEQDIEAQIDAVEDKFRGLQDTYEDISEDVAKQFEETLEPLRDQLAQELQPLEDRISELSEDLSIDTLTDDVKEQIQSEIDGLQTEVANRREQFDQETRAELDRLTGQATQQVSQELDAAKQELANLNNMQFENPLAMEQAQEISGDYANLGTGEVDAATETVE